MVDYQIRLKGAHQHRGSALSTVKQQELSLLRRSAELADRYMQDGYTVEARATSANLEHHNV